jgi:hypothetical protein
MGVFDVAADFREDLLHSGLTVDLAIDVPGCDHDPILPVTAESSGCPTGARPSFVPRTLFAS